MMLGGRVIGVYGIGKDLSAQRQLEQQLRQAQRMEAVARLAGGIAHDFNNLLTVIISYTQMLLRRLPPDVGGAELKEIDAAAARAANLTRQLLAYSRKQVLQPRRLDINQTVSEAAGMLRRVIGEDISLRTDLAPALWTVHADPGQLEQVLMNLAVNARDAMAGGGALTLRTANVTVDAAAARERPGLEPGAYAAIFVEDTGTGMEPETLANIFEPFYTTKPVGEGTGLGLAMVYGILKQSGGYVYVDSTPGVGSRFTVLLPKLEGSSEDESSAPEAPPPRGDETILLVEDEEAVRRAVRRMLEALGYSVLEAPNAGVALKVAADAETRGQRVHLVLTDVVMPGLNGRRLAEEVAARWPDTKVLYMSGYTDDEILRRGLVDADSSFLEKPFSTERLAHALRAVLGRATHKR
jgi:nitrogen-specific signal transduction histidine kinase/CheY-like chemotaxis protein